jgi:hypothetical protein
VGQQQIGWPPWPAMWRGGPRWSLKRVVLVWGALGLLAVPSLAVTLITGGLIVACGAWALLRALRRQLTKPCAHSASASELRWAPEADVAAHPAAGEDGE